MAALLRTRRLVLLALWCLPLACATAGSSWIAPEPPEADEEEDEATPAPVVTTPSTASPRTSPSVKARTLGQPTAYDHGTSSGAVSRPTDRGRALGKFRNTYYDFPSERDYQGSKVELKNGQCKALMEVPRGFFEAICVQGSGTLKSGGTVSFAKRDCECAEVCPRTSQRICFDLLDAARFPWGRGATGQPITPLLTVAVDSSVIPLGTSLYVPEYDGLPRDATQTSFHDGCFVAQDRGLRVQGKQIDVFTGHETVTKLWNRLVPSNRGVMVVLDSPRCARAPEGRDSEAH